MTSSRTVDEWVVPEWRGTDLTYVSPANTLRRFGFMFDGVNIDYRRTCDERVARQDGDVAPDRRQFPTLLAASEFVRVLAEDLGADDIGITAIDPKYVYAGVDLPHQFAVLIAVDMRFTEFVEAPSEQCHVEVWRAYDRVGELAVQIAEHLRRFGYLARAHTVKREEIALIPHAVAAGLGELGKHGSLIHPILGPTFRLSAVTTDLELEIDRPEQFGVDEFCTRCRLCVEFCPGDAISHDKMELRGTKRWVIDTEACVPFMASHEACGICLQVCPFNVRPHNGVDKNLFRTTVRRRRPAEVREALLADMQPQWSLVEQRT